jgi:uncharacterized membrane protein (DUF4010 family)
MPIETVPAFRALGIALALGLLVGMQRQRSQSLVAGVRTFALVTVLGTCCAIMATAVSSPSSAVGPYDADQARTEPASGDAADDTAGQDAADGNSDRDRESGSPDHGVPSGARSPGGGESGTVDRDRTPEPVADEPAASWGSIGSGAWILAAGGLSVVALAVLGNLIAVHKGGGDSGMSTEVAMLLMFAVGALAWLAPVQVPAAVGVATAILLHAKDALHRFTERIGEKDVRAVLTFALITFIILPVVPNETYGPFDVLNPHQAWRMVVLVVGISLAGYIATKLIGRSNGAIVSGLMGGLVSSTATTASAARQTADGAPKSSGGDQGRGENPAHHLDNLAATIILLATVVMYARVLVEVAVVARDHFAAIAPPVGVLMAVTLVLGVVVWMRSRKNGAELPESENPAQLRPALIFGVLYAVVLFIAAAGQHYLGSSGLYAVAAISGLTDMDAITLSSARLVSDDRLEGREAVNAILIGSTANMVFKTGMIASLGSRGLLRRIAVLYGVCAAAAIALALLWPA